MIMQMWKNVNWGNLGERYTGSPHGNFSVRLRLLQNFKKHISFIKSISRNVGSFHTSSIL